MYEGETVGDGREGIGMHAMDGDGWGEMRREALRDTSHVFIHGWR